MTQKKYRIAGMATLFLSATLFTGCSWGMDWFGGGDTKKAVEGVSSKVIDSDFTLTDTEGKVHQLSDYQGKKVYLKFWASWCGICMKTLGETNAFAGEDHKDFVVLSVVAPGVSGEMPKDKFISWFHGLNYHHLPVLLDEGGKVTRNYGVRFYPTSVIIDSEGVVREVRPGHMPKSAVLDVMAEIP